MRRSVASRHSLFGLLILTSLLFANVVAEDWPAFRGPSGQGRTTESNLPLTFSESENVTWKTAIPGKGWSSPVIWGDEIWMSTAVVEMPAESATPSPPTKGKKKKKPSLRPCRYEPFASTK